MAQDQSTQMDTAGPPAFAAGSGAEGSLEKLEALCTRRGSAGNAERVAMLAARLATQTFNLVVFGEFKRGKTTFVNALIGDDLLPSAVVPLTSVVTILHYAPRETIEVEFLDGSTRAIQRAELGDYVTEKGNPGNVKRVKVVRAGVPSPLLSNGMQLVDTPGVGSVYDHNTEAAREFLPHVDGAILLVASDPPISRGECEFLLEMRPHVARLFVVQNKVDQLRPQDLAESVDFTREVLREVLGDGDVRVFALSAREALEGLLSASRERVEPSGMTDFEEELHRFQAEEQAPTLKVSIISGALQIAEDERLGLCLEWQALRMSIEEIERRYQEFAQRRDAILAQREDDLTLARAAVARLIERTLREDYENERCRQVPLLRARFGEWVEAQGTLPVRKLLPRASEFIRQLLFEVLGEWKRSEERRLEEELSGSLDRLTTRTNEALASIYASAREAFELPPRPVETVGHLSARSRFLWRDWDWGPHVSPTGTLLAHALPSARGRLIQACLHNLLEEHDKGCGRLRYDFAQRARSASEDYVRSLRRALDEALDGIDRAITRVIDQKRGVTENVAQLEQRVSREMEELEAIVGALRAALPTGASHAG